MNDGMLYLKQGHVPSNEWIDILSHYLGGRAYNFYTREVSMRTKKWNLVTFFKGLFNYCFPIDFRNKQCRRLDNFVQGNKSIQDYVSELTELFTIVGTPGKCEQVTKLWYGFRKSIQKALYTAKLNPETLRWKEIVHEAEYHEMAERVDLDDDSPSNTHKSRFGGNGNNGRHGEGQSAQNGSNHRQGSNNAHCRERNHEQPPRHPSPRCFGQPAYGRHTNQRPSGSSFRGNTPVNHGNRFEQKPCCEDKKRTTLSKREEELRAAGKCFRCKEPRHMLHNCLTTNHMKASLSSGKPPGLGSYSIHLNLAETECQYESTLADTTAGMHLNALSFVLEDVRDSDSAVLVELSDSDDLPDLMSISDDGVGDKGIDSPKCENASDETSVEDEGSISDISEIRALPEPEMDLPTFMSIAEYHPVIHVTPPMNFEEFDGHISHPEICGVILDQYKIRDGEFENVRYAPARKMEYLLELSQPYPGDPANVLQYWGRRFMCY